MFLEIYKSHPQIGKFLVEIKNNKTLESYHNSQRGVLNSFVKHRVAIKFKDLQRESTIITLIEFVTVAL